MRSAPAGGGWYDPITRFFHDFGWIGVELFFVISAFLMTSLLLREHRVTGNIDIRKFFVRRILRIWPLYFFSIFVGLLVIPLVLINTSHGLGSVENVHLFRTYFLPYVLFLGNISIAIFGYPPSDALALLWSISAEEQFYLALPFLLLLLASCRLNAVTKLLIGISVFGVGVRCAMLLAELPHPAIWMTTLARPDSFLIGIMIATLNHRLQTANSLTANTKMILLAAAAALLLLPGQFPNIDQRSWHSVWQYPVISLSFGIVVMIFSVSERTRLTKFLPRRWFLWGKYRTACTFIT